MSTSTKKEEEEETTFYTDTDTDKRKHTTNGIFGSWTKLQQAECVFLVLLCVCVCVTEQEFGDSDFLQRCFCVKVDELEKKWLIQLLFCFD